MYGINGERDMEEQVLSHLQGYEHSAPVRIGNAAYKQQQNDVYGELIEAIYSYFIINDLCFACKDKTCCNDTKNNFCYHLFFIYNQT